MECVGGVSTQSWWLRGTFCFVCVSNFLIFSPLPKYILLSSTGLDEESGCHDLGCCLCCCCCFFFKNNFCCCWECFHGSTTVKSAATPARPGSLSPPLSLIGWNLFISFTFDPSLLFLPSFSLSLCCVYANAVKLHPRQQNRGGGTIKPFDKNTHTTTHNLQLSTKCWHLFYSGGGRDNYPSWRHPLFFKKY